VSGEQANVFVVCAREAGGAAVPSRDEIEDRLRERELSMLSDRDLRNLRREATIITRQ
jgi:peptidyl-prolyl cis-trans isomerase SurA